MAKKTKTKTKKQKELAEIAWQAFCVAQGVHPSEYNPWEVTRDVEITRDFKRAWRAAVNAVLEEAALRMEANLYKK